MLNHVTIQSLLNLIGLYRPVAAGLRLPKRLIFLTYTSEQMLEYLYREYENFIQKNNMENIALKIISEHYNRCAAGPDQRLVAMTKLLARRAATHDYDVVLNGDGGKGHPC